MTPHDPRQRLAALLPEVALLLVGLLAERKGAAPLYYTRDRLPDEAESWRQVLDLHRAGKLHATRQGRRLIVSAADWQAYLDACGRAPRRRRVKSADPLLARSMKAA